MTAKRVAFTDQRLGFDPATDPLVAALPASAELTPDVAEADLVVHSLFGREHLKARGAKLLYSGDPWTSRSASDWTIDWRLVEQDRHLRMLTGLVHALGHTGAEGEAALYPAPDPAGRDFCNFIYSNGRCPMRNAFYSMLDRRRRVASLGSVHHDTDDPSLGRRSDAGWHDAKMSVLSKYRFTIAFESTELAGYTSEKIIDALQADTVPIYWGNPCIDLDVDPRCFISFYDHPTLSKLVERVLEVDEDPALYEQYRRHNPFRTGRMNEQLADTRNALTAFLTRVLTEARPVPTATRYRARVKYAARSLTDRRAHR